MLASFSKVQNIKIVKRRTSTLINQDKEDIHQTYTILFSLLKKRLCANFNSLNAPKDPKAYCQVQSADFWSASTAAQFSVSDNSRNLLEI